MLERVLKEYVLGEATWDEAIQGPRLFKGKRLSRAEEAARDAGRLDPRDPQRIAAEKELKAVYKQRVYIERLLEEETNLDSPREWWKLIQDAFTSEKTKSEIWSDVRYKIKRWLEQRWGFFWVSIFWPARHIMEFLIVHKRLPDKKPSQGGQYRLRTLIQVETLPTKFLLRQPPRPTLLENVEFNDRLQGDIVPYAIFRVVMPYTPVFTWKEKFYEALESQLGSEFLSFAQLVKWVDFVKKVRKGPGSGLHLKWLSRINVRTAISLTGETIGAKVDLGGKGIIEAIGLELVDSWIHDYEGLEGTVDLNTIGGALRAAELNRLKGDALIIEQEKKGQAELVYAIKRAQAIKAVGEQEAWVLQEKAKASVPVAVAEQQVKGREALKGTGVTTIIESGAPAANVLVPTNSSKT